MSRADGLVRTRDGDLVPDPEQAAVEAAADERAAAAAHGCDDGWIGEDEHGRPVPCHWCRPHLLPRSTRPDGLHLSGPTTRRDRASASRPPAPVRLSRNREVPPERTTQPAAAGRSAAVSAPIPHQPHTTPGATVTSYLLHLSDDADLADLAEQLEHRASELRAAGVAESTRIAAARAGRPDGGRRPDVRNRAVEVVLDLAHADRLHQAASSLREARRLDPDDAALSYARLDATRQDG